MGKGREEEGGRGLSKPFQYWYNDNHAHIAHVQLVHSRTFGNASASGGVGVHMLVPLVDMLNHGGDETNSGLLADPSHTSTDNVRCGTVTCDGLFWRATTGDVGLERSSEIHTRLQFQQPIETGN